MLLAQHEHMPLAVFGQAFDHEDWLFELKYDGFRAHAHLADGGVRLVSRKTNKFRIAGTRSKSKPSL